MEGFVIPIHRSLTQPILLGGAPREFAILNGTVTLALLVGLQTIIGLPVGILLHIVGRTLAKGDPQFLDTFKRHIHFRPYYEV